MRTVKEVSELSGVSVRTLHHYDAVGLLKPTAVTEAGYRLYDHGALLRLQNILLFREIGFSLKEIKGILDGPNFDLQQALKDQIEMLKLQEKRTQSLIRLAYDMMEKGGKTLEFQPFDNHELENFAKEAKERWSGSNAYKEYEERAKDHTAQEENKMGVEMMELFAEMGSMRHLAPDCQEVQAKVKELQAFITEHYYTCDLRILSGLGQMYVQDQRFRENIDSWGGTGTAEFAGQAIEIYCKG
ncbi:MAG: MerR family transcriptional regulator [Firmicutes bacterium]|nr:MerR family transcriptional regulator [Bacillota bacterium]